LPPEQAGYAATIFTSTNSLLAVINEILDYSRIEAGKLELDPVPVAIDELLDECVSLFAVQSRTKGVELLLDIDAALPATMELDPLRVKQIINNLLGNAFKFTEQGFVHLSVYSDHVPHYPGLRIEVVDSGMGMNDEQQHRLFQEFSQADRSIVRRFGGTGLGLAICKKLTLLMGGSIDVVSAPGQGSRFIVQLPSVRAHSLEPVVPALHHRKVLVIADSPARESYMRQCRRWGVEVTGSTRDMPVLDTIVEVFDAVVVDEDYIGLLAVQRLRARIEASSGCSLLRLCNELPRDCAVDCSHCLSKPLTLVRLRDALLELISPESAQPSHHLVGAVATDWSGLAVMVAEDNSINQLVVKQLLAKLSIEPVMVSDGQQVVNCLNSGSWEPDIILMDCNMPIMDGYDATDIVRKLPLRKRPWIIGLSANAGDDDVTRATSAGMDDYVSKPITLAQLRRAIERGLQNREALADHAGHRSAAP
jgi:hypothetical protein